VKARAKWGKCRENTLRKRIPLILSCLCLTLHLEPMVEIVNAQIASISRCLGSDRAKVL
jgi:hypothetical protein